MHDFHSVKIQYVEDYNMVEGGIWIDGEFVYPPGWVYAQEKVTPHPHPFSLTFTYNDFPFGSVIFMAFFGSSQELFGHLVWTLLKQ